MPSINELTLAKELIRFPSVTPVDAGAIVFLSKKLKSLGFKCKILEFKDKTSKPIKNLYARLGTKQPNICYAGHTDVVPPGNIKDWTVNPFKPKIKKKYLIGRGANDMKSSIACFVSAVNKFLTKKEAVIILNLLCIYPVSQSSLIPASTIGKPVLPFFHFERSCSLSFQSNLSNCTFKFFLLILG